MSKNIEKGSKKMQNEEMLEILQRIQICIKRDSLYEAKLYIKLEIKNLQGVTEKECKNSRYYCEDLYCSDCRNLNCNSNTNN